MGIWVLFCLGVGGVEDERSRLGCRGGGVYKRAGYR